MKEQFRFITEEEYQELLVCKGQRKILIDELDRISSSLYPDNLYYIGPGALDVALEQIYNMAREICANRNKFHFFKKQKIKDKEK